MKPVTKWGINSSKIPVNHSQLDKVKGEINNQITPTKMKMLIKKSSYDQYEQLDFNPNKSLHSSNISQRIVIEKNNSSKNDIHINTDINEERSSQNFNLSLIMNEDKDKDKDRKEEYEKNYDKRVINVGRNNIQSMLEEIILSSPAFKLSLKKLFLLPKSILRILYDGSSELNKMSALKKIRKHNNNDNHNNNSNNDDSNSNNDDDNYNNNNNNDNDNDTNNDNYNNDIKEESVPNNLLNSINFIHSIKSVIAYNSSVYSCGQNSYGELGHSDGLMRKFFNKIIFLEGKGVVSIGAGNEHSIFVSTDGKVYVSGYNDNGQCGNGNIEQVKLPQQVMALDNENITQVFVFNGCEHTLVITKDGRLYSFGYNYRGQVCIIVVGTHLFSYFYFYFSYCIRFYISFLILFIDYFIN